MELVESKSRRILFRVTLIQKLKLAVNISFFANC